VIGEQIYRLAQGVGSEERGGTAQQLDPAHVLERQQVEVDLCHPACSPAPVEEDRDALRQPHHRAGGEAAVETVVLNGLPSSSYTEKPA
jgi:hypothetical protein